MQAAAGALGWEIGLSEIIAEDTGDGGDMIVLDGLGSIEEGGWGNEKGAEVVAEINDRRGGNTPTQFDEGQD